MDGLTHKRKTEVPQRQVGADFEDIEVDADIGDFIFIDDTFLEADPSNDTLLGLFAGLLPPSAISTLLAPPSSFRNG